MTPSVHTGSFKLARQSAGRGFYAEVALEVLRGSAVEPRKIAFAEDVFVYAHGPEFLRGAKRGVAIALAAYPDPVAEVRIEKLSLTLVDSTEEGVAFATCFAVWDALQVCGIEPPVLRDGIFIFPKNP